MWFSSYAVPVFVTRTLLPQPGYKYQYGNGDRTRSTQDPADLGAGRVGHRDQIGVGRCCRRLDAVHVPYQYRSATRHRRQLVRYTRIISRSTRARGYRDGHSGTYPACGRLSIPPPIQTIRSGDLQRPYYEPLATIYPTSTAASNRSSRRRTVVVAPVAFRHGRRSPSARRYVGSDAKLHYAFATVL